MTTAVSKKDVNPLPKKTAAKATEAGGEEPKTGHQADDDAGREPADLGVDSPQAPTESEAPAAGVDVHHGCGGLYVVAGGVRQLLHRTASKPD